MARWQRILPPRRVDPLWRIRTYVDRRAGLPDAARNERERREQKRRGRVFGGGA